MNNESYMKIRDTIEKSLNDFRLALNWLSPVDISTRSGPDGVRISFDCFEDAKEPSTLEAINSAGLILKNSYFVLHADNHSITLRNNSTVINRGGIIEFEGILDTEKRYPLEYRDICRKGPWRVEIKDDTTKIALDGEYLYSESYPHDDGFGNIIAKSRVYKFKKFERKKEPTPTPTSRIYYRKYFDANHDDYRSEEFQAADDKCALFTFRKFIHANTDKVRWNPMELYRYDHANYKYTLYSCDKHKPDYQKIDEINSKLRNMK